MIGNNLTIHKYSCLVPINSLHAQQKIYNSYVPHTEYEDLLNLGDYNVFFRGSVWEVESRTVRFRIVKKIVLCEKNK